MSRRITIGGVEHVIAGTPPTYVLPIGSTSTLGGVKPDGTTISVAADGTVSSATTVTQVNQISVPGAVNVVLKTTNDAQVLAQSTMTDDGTGVAMSGTNTVTGLSTLNGGVSTTDITASGTTTLGATTATAFTATGTASLQATTVTDLTTTSINNIQFDAVTYTALLVGVGSSEITTTATGYETNGLSYSHNSITYYRLFLTDGTGEILTTNQNNTNAGDIVYTKTY